MNRAVYQRFGSLLAAADAATLLHIMKALLRRANLRSDFIVAIIALAGLMMGTHAWGQKNQSIESPREEREAMARFQKALQDQRWDDALALCSGRVRASAAVYASKQIFFRAVVPVEQIVDAKSFPVSGGQTKGASNLAQPRTDEFVRLTHFVRIPQQPPSPDVSWAWTTYKLDSRWIIDFEPKALSDVIESEIARLKQENEDARRSGAVADHAITRVKTRLTGLNKSYAVGQPVLFRLELVNECDLALVYTAGRVAVDGCLNITDGNGEPVIFTGGPVQTAIRYERIESGNTVALFDNLDLGRLYNLSKPGRYRVQFSGEGLSLALPAPKTPEQDHEQPLHTTTRKFASNVVEIDIEPSQQR